MTTFKIHKYAALFLCLVVIACMAIGCFYLRPIDYDGSRTSFQVISESTIIYDHVNYRFIMVPFQLPVLALKHWFGVTSPLTLIRFYFYLVTMPILTFAFFKIVKATDYTDLILFTFLILIAWVPGFSFAFNATFEATFFFVLAGYYFFKDKYLAYFGTLLAFSVGHPGIVFGAGLLSLGTGFELWRKKNMRSLGYFVGALASVGIIYFRLLSSAGVEPENIHFVNKAIEQFLGYYERPELFALTMCIVLGLSFLIFLIHNRYVQYAYMALAVFPFVYFNVLGVSTSYIFTSAHDFRRFSLVMSFVAFVFMFVRNFFYRANRSAEFFIMTYVLVLGAQFVYFEMQLTKKSAQLFTELRNLPPVKGVCRIVALEHEQFFSPMPLPILKFFVDDKRKIESFTYSSRLVSDKFNPCNHFSQYYLPLGYIFKIKPVTNIPYTYLYGIDLNREPQDLFQFDLLNPYPQRLATRDLGFTF